MVPAKNQKAALYNSLKNEYPAAAGCIITDSYLRLEANVQGSFTNIQFNMLVNQGGQNVTEKRLAITDKFCALDVAAFIMKAGTSTSATQAEISQAALRTYPNNQVFTGAGEAAAFQALYNSYLQMKVDSVVYVDSLDLMRFYRVPTSQKGVAVSTVATTGVIQNDGFDNLNYAFSPMLPTVTFGGKSKNEVSIQLPTSTTLSGTSSTNLVVCYFRGFLIQNGAR